MKREKLSMLVLIVEIVAIIYLHSVKNRQSITGEKVATNGKKSPAAVLQLPVSGLK